MTSQHDELVSCALPAWYSAFSSKTIKSEFIELPQRFVDYLTSDGIVLPQGCDLPLIEQEGGMEEEESGMEREKEGETWNQPPPHPPPPPPSFPQLLPRISAAIVALGGRGVVPKLNWSTPRDATWIATTNTLCCTTPAEVVLLLKSSDFIAHDISRVSEINSSHNQSDPFLQCTLCLRQWVDINPSSEFRCFVCDGEVIGACQRDVSTHFPFLLPLKDQLLQELVTFHRHQVTNLMSPDKYVFDVFREKESEYVLVDFNPFSPLTDPLLYQWEELEAWQGDTELRLVDASCIQPSQHQICRLPQDIVDLSTGEDINKFVDLFHANGLDKS